MSDLTDERVKEYLRTYYDDEGYEPAVFTQSRAREGIERLIASGWTIEPPPEPEYFVGIEAYHAVVRHKTGLEVARFNIKFHPHARAAAEAERDRLIKEAESR